MDFLLEPLEGTQNCRHPIFNPVRPNLDLWPSEMQGNKIVWFKLQN